MVKAIFDELAAATPRSGFTIGIDDDVTHTSLAYDPSFSTEDQSTVRAIFYGLGADGTVGANKNSIKIIGEETDNYAQGYFVYDSKKSGLGDHLAPALRAATDPRRVSHQPGHVRRVSPVLLPRAPGRAREPRSPAPSSCSTARTGPTRSGTSCPAPCRRTIIAKRLRFFVVDGDRVAREAGMGGRINTVMQTCFFAISGVLPRDEAIARHQARDREDLREARRGGGAEELGRGGRRPRAPARGARSRSRDQRQGDRGPPVPPEAPEFVQKVTARMIAGQGRPPARERVARGRHLSRPERPSGRSAASRSRSRCGTRSCASSAASACSSVRTR